jgi:hypothetical protein
MKKKKKSGFNSIPKRNGKNFHENIYVFQLISPFNGFVKKKKK